MLHLYSSLAYALRVRVRVIKVTIYIEYIVFYNAMVEYALALLILLPCQVQCKEEKKRLAFICIMKNKLSNWISIQSYAKVGLDKNVSSLLCYNIISVLMSAMMVVSKYSQSTIPYNYS